MVAGAVEFSSCVSGTMEISRSRLLQMRARRRSARHARYAAVRSGSHERAQVLLQRGSRRPARLPHDPAGRNMPTTQPSALRRGTAWHQRPQVIEIRNVIRAIHSGPTRPPISYRSTALQQVMSAMELAAQQRSWVDVEQLVQHEGAHQRSSRRLDAGLHGNHVGGCAGQPVAIGLVSAASCRRRNLHISPRRETAWLLMSGSVAGRPRPAIRIRARVAVRRVRELRACRRRARR